MTGFGVCADALEAARSIGVFSVVSHHLPSPKTLVYEKNVSLHI